MDNGTPERYFYHSFPRRGVSTNAETDKGFAILAAIRDFGLMLTPQLIEWKQPSLGGAPRTFPVLQKRVCFTELMPTELTKHAEKFGSFALEFEIDTVRRLGAVPVFYVPQPTSDSIDGSAVGTYLLSIAMDSHALLRRMASLDGMLNGPTPVLEKFGYRPSFAQSPEKQGDYILDRDESKNFLSAVGHGITPWNLLGIGAYAMLNFFHPTDNEKQDRVMEYYREREWRIACAFRLNNPDGTFTEVMHLPTPEERERLLQVDREFFGRIIKTDLGEQPTLDQIFVLPGLRVKKIIEMARRIIVPAGAEGRAKELLKDLKNSPPVISMNEIVVA